MHGLVEGRVAGGQVWACEVTTLVVVVLHIEVGQFGVVDFQCVAPIVNVLAVQRLHRAIETKQV